MHHHSAAMKLASTVATPAKVFSVLLLLSLFGCEARNYHVMLAVDAREYRPTMTWDEIRNSTDKKPYGIRLFDVDGHAVPLYRFMHESPGIMPLDETRIHINTPIIIEKKYDTVYLSVFAHGSSNELTRIRVVIK